jgi:hypothetical protein
MQAAVPVTFGASIRPSSSNVDEVGSVRVWEDWAAIVRVWIVGGLGVGVADGVGLGDADRLTAGDGDGTAVGDGDAVGDGVGAAVG